MAKTVDVYMPLDARAEPNREVWPIARKQLGELVRVIEKCGWKANVLNPGGPVSSVAQGIRTVRDARGERFLNFIGGWAYPDFSVSPFDDPRASLARWMTDPENPYFARTMANRMWGHFLGRGIIHPIDDARSTNPPSNPELLDALAKDFVAGGYDVKRLIREIVTSRKIVFCMTMKIVRIFIS